jgi:hypothetical protein
MNRKGVTCIESRHHVATYRTPQPCHLQKWMFASYHAVCALDCIHIVCHTLLFWLLTFISLSCIPLATNVTNVIHNVSVVILPSRHNLPQCLGLAISSRIVCRHRLAIRLHHHRPLRRLFPHHSSSHRCLHHRHGWVWYCYSSLQQCLLQQMMRTLHLRLGSYFRKSHPCRRLP